MDQKSKNTDKILELGVDLTTKQKFQEGGTELEYFKLNFDCKKYDWALLMPIFVTLVPKGYCEHEL